MISLIIIILIVIILGIALYYSRFRENLDEKLADIEQSIKIGDYENSIAKLEMLKEKNPDNIYIHWLLGEAYYKKGLYDLAEKEIEKAIALKTFSENLTEEMCRKFLGDIYYKEGKYDKAFQEYIIVSKSNPDDIDIFFKLGSIAFEKKSYRDALLYFDKYKNLNPADAKVYYWLGLTSLYLNLLPDAELNLKKSLELDNSMTEVHYYLGELYMKKQMYSEAAREFSFNQKDEKLSRLSLLKGGKANYYIKKYSEAIKNLEKIINWEEIDEEEKKEILYILADSYQKIGDISQALKYFNMLKGLDEDYKDVNSRINSLINLTRDNILNKFSTSDPDELLSLAKEFCTLRGLIYKEHNLTPDNGILDVLATNKMQQGELFLIEFIRFETTIGELILRELEAKRKDLKASKSILVSVGEFSDSAKDFAQKNKIELINASELIKTFLKK